jgi:hypothetical protein
VAGQRGGELSVGTSLPSALAAWGSTYPAPWAMEPACNSYQTMSNPKVMR